jgi:hypothetical protein
VQCIYIPPLEQNTTFAPCCAEKIKSYGVLKNKFDAVVQVNIKINIEIIYTSYDIDNMFLYLLMFTFGAVVVVMVWYLEYLSGKPNT